MNFGLSTTKTAFPGGKCLGIGAVVPQVRCTSLIGTGMEFDAHDLWINYVQEFTTLCDDYNPTCTFRVDTERSVVVSCTTLTGKLQLI